MRLRRLLLGVMTVMTLVLPVAASQGAEASGASTPTTSQPVPSCTRLVVAAGTTEGGLGTGTLVLLLANAGPRCEVGGYPRVEFFSVHGVAVDTRDLHVSSMFYAEPRSRTVALAHNGVASVGVSWSDNPINHETCPRVAWATVTLPHGVGSLSGSPGVWASPCGGSLTVTPIEVGPVPAPNE